MHSSPQASIGELSEPMRIVDVAPTLLADIDASWPALIDGRPRADVFASERARVARSCENAGAFVDLSPHEAEDPLVTERLRAMGYL